MDNDQTISLEESRKRTMDLIDTLADSMFQKNPSRPTPVLVD